MQEVALYLQEQAIRISTEPSADVYGRSAFNRYYYAAFLTIRECLLRIEPKWQEKLNHKDIPGMLRGTVKKEVEKKARMALKIGDTKEYSDCSAVKSLTLELAGTIEKAYAIRVVADYDPEIRVKFTEQRFSLSGINITDAHQWFEKSNQWSNRIRATLNI